MCRCDWHWCSFSLVHVSCGSGQAEFGGPLSLKHDGFQTAEVGCLLWLLLHVLLFLFQTLQAHLLMPYPSNSSNASSSMMAASVTAANRMGQDVAAVDPAAGAVGSPGVAGPAAAPVMRSVYALAMNQPGTMVAAGTTESYIRLLDPRSGQKIMKLKVGPGSASFLQQIGRIPAAAVSLVLAAAEVIITRASCWWIVPKSSSAGAASSRSSTAGITTGPVDKAATEIT